MRARMIFLPAERKAFLTRTRGNPPRDIENAYSEQNACFTKFLRNQTGKVGRILLRVSMFPFLITDSLSRAQLHITA